MASQQKIMGMKREHGIGLVEIMISLVLGLLGALPVLRARPAAALRTL